MAHQLCQDVDAPSSRSSMSNRRRPWPALHSSWIDKSSSRSASKASRTPNVLMAAARRVVLFTLMALLVMAYSTTLFRVLSHARETTPTRDYRDKVSPNGNASRSLVRHADDPAPQAQLPPTPTSFSIFYNIYIPAMPDTVLPVDATKVKAIVTEQMDIIALSDAVKQFDEVIVNYLTIGAPHVIDEGFMSSICHRDKLKCRHVRHETTGNEELTLQAVWEHCQLSTALQQPQPARVGYLHAKGTFHDTAWNGMPQEHWRRHGTRAVVFDKCIHPPDTTCNLCSIMTTIWPFLHSPGNFFTASCDYVRTLTAPKAFQQAMDKVNATRQMLIETEHRFESNLFDYWGSTLGTGRYANEHWIGSSPDVRPCDLSDTENPKFWQRKDHPDEAFVWAMQPRKPIPAIRQHSVASSRVLRLKEYFLLAGCLHKWYALYHKAPPMDSWIWKWYPDGGEWKEAVRRYGAGALEAMLRSGLNGTTSA